jgi:alpha-methylacyl-CoA racemase
VSAVPRPLDGVRVLDFSTLLPGPLATLILTEAGADVTKVERPDRGDEMRSYTPKLGHDSANFALLNRGKQSVAVDLKDSAGLELLLDALEHTDVLIEQFRPGVMDRLGLGYEAVAERNPAIIYCSITGYGQTGPSANRAGHDLNYLAESGLLAAVVDGSGDPPLYSVLAADILGGAYPAVMNILLALRRRDLTGVGCYLDICMARNLRTAAYSQLATWQSTGSAPPPGQGLLTGGSPRWQIYRTADGRHLAAAPLEDKFWHRFMELIELPTSMRLASAEPGQVIEAVAELIAARPTEYWQSLFEGEDVCVTVVTGTVEAIETDDDLAASPDRLVADGFEVPALPVPLDAVLRGEPRQLGYPSLGADTSALRNRDDPR